MAGTDIAMDLDDLHDTVEAGKAQASRGETDMAVATLRRVVFAETTSEEANKIREQGIQALVEVLMNAKRAADLSNLLTELRPWFNVVPKARTAKIVRLVVEALSRIPDTLELQAELCRTSIEWCKAEKRSFLRLRLESRLALVYLEQLKYQPSLTLINSLLREVKKLEDKQLLVEIHLLESQVYHALHNTPKAKAALTAARTNASAIYVPPELQAEIDMQAGTLHVEDRDYKTSYSYFFEAFEGFHSLNDPRALKCLKYMILSKIMTGQTDEVQGIAHGKQGLAYAGPAIDAMRVVARAHKERSLHGFKEALDTYRAELMEDPLISRNLEYLCDTLLERNLLLVLEPFSRVEITHVAELMQLPQHEVATKLSHMILDKKLNGTLDQGAGHLLLFQDNTTDTTYTNCLATITNLNSVVDSLFRRAAQIQ